MRVYRIAPHVHGSMSEGPASYLAHDHEIAQGDLADAIWWMDHDWRVANCFKVRSFSFDEEIEYLTIPNRNPGSPEPTTEIAMTWRPDPNSTTAEGCRATISRTVVHSGTGSLRVEMPPAGEGQSRGERVCAFEFHVDVMHERYPLLSRPKVRLALFPQKGVGEGNGGVAFVRFRLSEQPPDLTCSEIVYVLGEEGLPTVTDNAATIPLPAKSGVWNEYEFDLAADVLRLGLAGGLDNSLHRMYIGLRGREGGVCAHFDSLEIAPEFAGPEMLGRQRVLIASLPMKLAHLVGTEISYYGAHVNAYGSSVPIPDYERLLPKRLTTSDIVRHIHEHGGLASYNHPGVLDPDKTAAELIQHSAYGADLIEVGHARRGLFERLGIWDRLGQAGLILTAVAVSDAHGAAGAWRPRPGKPWFWVTHIWAKSLAESDLLEALGRGRVYVADPEHFRGTIKLVGPGGANMGDVLVGSCELSLEVEVAGVLPGDRIEWIAGGEQIMAETANEERCRSTWAAEQSVERLVPVRVQVVRPSLAQTAYGGLIAVSNPIYLASAPVETKRLVVEA